MKMHAAEDHDRGGHSLLDPICATNEAKPATGTQAMESDEERPRAGSVQDLSPHSNKWPPY